MASEESQELLEDSSDIQDYNLPVVDVCNARRNFPGYSEDTYYTYAELIQGDTAGTTETDSKTDTKGSGGYTKINSKSTKVRNY